MKKLINNIKLKTPEAKKAALIFGGIALFYSLFCLWFMWNINRYALSMNRYKETFTQEELDVLQAELQMNLKPGYTVYKAMYNSDRLCVEIYTEQNYEEIWKDLFGIETGKNRFVKVSKWENLDKEIVEGSIIYPRDYNQDICRDISADIGEKDNGYCILIEKDFTSFQYEDELIEMFDKSE